MPAESSRTNKLVGLLHGVLDHRTPYNPDIAWRHWLDECMRPAADQIAA